MQSSDQNRLSGEAPAASRPSDAAGSPVVSVPIAQHSPSPSQISLPASTSTWSALVEDQDGDQAGTTNQSEENDMVQVAISPSELTQTNRRSLRIANPFADLEKPPGGNDPKPGGDRQDGTTSAVPQPETKPSAYEIPYFMRLKAGRNYTGWFLRDMLVAEEFASPTAEKLAKPILPTRVAVIDWENLQSAPRSEVFRVGNSKRDDHVPELVGGLPNLLQTKVTRDQTGEQLRKSLQRKSDGTRLIVVEDLSRDVVGVLGTEFDLDYEFFEEHICPKSDTPEPLAGAHLPRPYVHLRWYHPIRMNRSEAQRLGCFRQGDGYANDWSLVNSAFERQSWDLPTHQPIKQISTFKGDDSRNPSILSSLSASNQYPKYSSRNGTREEQISFYFVPPSPEEGKPSAIIILVDPVLLFAIGDFPASKTYSDKRPATVGAIPSATATLLLDSFREKTWPDDCGTHVLHQTLVSIITDLIRNDAITAIIDMKNEMRAINTERRDLHAIENTIDLWDKTLSGIQEQLSVYRRAVKTIFATHTALLWSEESSTSASLLFRRGLFTDFGEDMDANRYSKDLLKIIDESLSQATETFNTLRTTLSIYESQQAIAQASAINRLTEMVFIFIPLSFSTSIFGMQMKEFANVGLATWGIIAGALLGAIFLLRLISSSRGYERIKTGFLDWVRHSQGLAPGSNVAALDGTIALITQRVLLLWTAFILLVSLVPAFVWSFSEGSIASKTGWTVFSFLNPLVFGFFFPRFLTGRDMDWGKATLSLQICASVFFIAILPLAVLPPLWVRANTPLDSKIAWTTTICSLSVVAILWCIDTALIMLEEAEVKTTDVWAALSRLQAEEKKKKGES